MSVRKLIALLVGVFFALCNVAVAQVRTDSLTVYFKQNNSDYNKTYQDNESRVEKFLDKLTATPDTLVRRSVHLMDICVSASPDGLQSLNRSIVKKRFDTVYKYFKQRLPFADSVVVVAKIHEDWDGVRKFIENADVSWRDEALEIIDKEVNPDMRELRLRYLHNGIPWEYLAKYVFPELRRFTVYVKTSLDFPKLPAIDDDSITEAVILTLTGEDEMEIASVLGQAGAEDAQEDTLGTASEECQREMKVKVNAVGVAMGQANVAVEVDLAPHWSLALPFYYSGGVDYFKETIKFRGIVFQPEVRYYLKENAGFYVGAHLGVGWYNFALNKDWRIQDYNGNRPSWGGGLGLGYSMQFKKHPAWGMEFAVGAGVYDSKYDIFYNEANGPYHKRGVHKTWIGVDNASVAFTYKFGLKKKGGKK